MDEAAWKSSMTPIAPLEHSRDMSFLIELFKLVADPVRNKEHNEYS